MSRHSRKSPITNFDQISYYQDQSSIMGGYKITSPPPSKSRRHTVAFTRKKYISDDSINSLEICQMDDLKKVKTSPPPAWHKQAAMLPPPRPVKTTITDIHNGFIVENGNDSMVVRTIPNGKKTLVQFGGGDLFNIELLCDISGVTNVGESSSIYSDMTQTFVYVHFDDGTIRTIRDCTLELFGCALEKINTPSLDYSEITKVPSKKKTKRISIWKRPFHVSR